MRVLLKSAPYENNKIAKLRLLFSYSTIGFSVLDPRGLVFSSPFLVGFLRRKLYFVGEISALSKPTCYLELPDWEYDNQLSSI